MTTQLVPRGKPSLVDGWRDASTEATRHPVSYTHLTLPTTPYV